MKDHYYSSHRERGCSLSKYAEAFIGDLRDYVYDRDDYSPAVDSDEMTGVTRVNMPATSPPPPYHSFDQRYAPANQPPPFYYQQYYSQPTLPPPRTTTNAVYNRPPPWQPTVSLPASRVDPPPPPPPQSQFDDAAPHNDCPIARGMNQGAAFCDRVASRLNEVLCRLEVDNPRNEDIEALAQGFDIPYNTSSQEPDPSRRERRHTEPERTQPKSGIINFKKTWMYGNSRLPPQMLPFKVYMPTWQIFCRAAEASVAAYQRPRGNETEDYIDADWRKGTKAMVLKSVCMDEKNLIVFAIRGSKWNLVDWAVNFRPAPKEPVGFLDDQGNACHAGFLQVARAMVKPVAARLRELLEQDPSRAGSALVITGHSAGGAVASLLYMHMLSTTVESDLNVLTGCFRRVHCVTFGAPPVTLLPLQKPEDSKSKKNVFMAFANEGDPVVRADKQYLYSLGRLIAAPPPNLDIKQATHRLITKTSRQMLRLHNNNSQPPKKPSPAPYWIVPEAPLSNAGRVVLLRTKPSRPQDVEAVCVSDEQLRNVVFGDPSMHDMSLYKRRIDELAIAAVTGRE